MDVLSYYAHMTADAKQWTDHFSPLSKRFVGHVDVYNDILPMVPFSRKDFIKACIKARQSRFHIPCCGCGKSTGISIFKAPVSDPNGVYCCECSDKLLEECA